MKATALALALAGVASAQQSAWGQCGGIGWTGATTCVDGWHCVYQNDWYYQCLQGSATSTAASSTSKTSSAVTTTATTSKATTSSTTSKVSSTTSTTKVSSTTSKTSSVPTSTGFATTDGTLFKIDGVTSYYAGTNCYWCSFMTSKSDLELTFGHIASSGIKIVRIWGFNDRTSAPGTNDVYFQYLSSSGSTINTGTYGLQLLDNAVSVAEANGLKLIINFVNNWDDYGGISAYLTAFGGTHTGWYTNTAAQTQYKKYIDAVISRYKSSSAIFAWELANEPRCNGCNTTVITTWATEISAYIKSLDPYHMVTLGDEGFGLDGDGSYPYQYSEGINWADVLAIDNLDFGTFHLYTESWGVSTSTFGQPWVQNHGKLCVAAGKPCFFEEYGTSSNHCTNEAPWQETALNTSGIAGDAFWQWGDTFSWGQSSNDGNTVYYNSSDWTCLVQDHVADINALY